MRILQNDTKRSSQIVFFDLSDVNLIVADLAFLNIVETVDQVGDGRLSGTGGTDKRDFLARLCKQRYVVQNDFFRVVAKINVFEDNASLQLTVINRSVRLMRMLPCPSSGTLFRLGELSVFFFCIDECYISFVELRLLIHQTEDTVGTGKCHNNRVQLLADLVDRHVEALVESQEACQTAESKAADTVQCKGTADNSADHVAHISKLCVDRSDDVGESVCIVSTLIQVIVDLFEFCNVVLFVTEDLDNLLAVHHFLDETVDSTKGLLLFHEVASGKSGHFFRYGKHDRYHNECCNRQRNVQNQHADKDADNRDRTVDDLRNTLADHLTQRIDIVRVDRHDIAV